VTAGAAPLSLTVLMGDSHRTLWWTLGLLFATLALWLAALGLGSQSALAFPAAALYVGLGLALWRISQVHFLLILPYYYGYFTAVVSNVYIEQGAYISEQYRFSFPTGSTFRLTLFAGLFLASAFWTSSVVAPLSRLKAMASATKRSGTFHLVSCTILLVVALWLCALLTSGLVFGFPLLQRIDRFTYWSAHPYPYFWRILIHGMQLSFLLGIVAALADRAVVRRSAAAAFALILMTNILFGDKFSSSAMALLNFGTAAAMTGIMVRGVRLRLMRYTPLLVIAAAGFFVLVSWSYRAVSNVAPQFVLDYIVSRALGLQGHTWWGIDLLVREGNTNGVGPEHLLRDHSPGAPGGLYLLMFALAPAHSVAAYMEKGISFTMGGAAIAIYALGYALAVPFMIAAGMLTGLALGYLARKTASGHLWRAWIALKLTWIALLAFNMGNVYLLLSTSVVLYLAIVLADLLRQGVSIGDWRT
jgi:hypothetical protein